MRHTLRLFTTVLLISTGLIAIPARGAGSFLVNSTRDGIDRHPGDGVCETQVGNRICTLRAAIQEANALDGPDTITLPAGLYLLTLPGIVDDVSSTGDLDITSDITLNGAGATETIIDANHIDRALHILRGATATVSGVTIQHGEGSNEPFGGGVLDAGALTLDDSIVRSNISVTGGGIALADSIPPVLVLNRTIITDNTATAFGGALGISGTVVINDSALEHNTAGHSGGAIWTNMQLDVNNSIIRDNNALYWAGGILNIGDTRINGTTIVGNHSADGAGVFNEEQLDIRNSTISGNVAANNGGGFINRFIATLTNVTISGNSAQVHGGGIFNQNIYPNTDDLRIFNSTIVANQASGTDTGNGGGMAIDAGGIHIANSIVGQNIDASGRGPNCLGTLDSRGYNLSDNWNDCTLTGDLTGNQTGALQIGLLQDNGGSTLTHALLAGSPAIDSGNPTGCVDALGAALTTDQRGLIRPRDGDGNGSVRCDIGAYEVQSLESPPPAACRAVGSADIGNGTSQVFTLDPHERSTHPLGSAQPGADIEGLAIHPVTSAIYVSSGDSGTHHGALGRIDPDTGTWSLIGATGFPNVTALTFRSTDRSLWGWAKGQGLITIDPASGAATLLRADATAIDGLVWNAEGTQLYGLSHTLLWSYDPGTGAVSTIATNAPHDIVSLAMRADGRLLGATQHGQGVRLFIYDIAQARAYASDRVATPYSDVEFIAWPGSCAATSVPSVYPAHLDATVALGAPGSYFPISGTDFPPNTLVPISVQDHIAGTVESDADGALATQIYVDPYAQPGEYLVDSTVTGPTLSAAAVGTQAVLTIDLAAQRISFASGSTVLNARPTIYLPMLVRY